ncbi:hypothetical protein D3C78_406560 [compost metagenome]
MNPGLFLFLLLWLSGVGLSCAGMHILYGPGWALIAGGIASFAACGFIRKGMTGG